METSFLELRNKEVINVVDGSLLGRIIDVVFDIRTSRVLGFIVPGVRAFFNIFKSCPEIFVPYKNICKIGDDVILVEIFNIPRHNRRGYRLYNQDRTHGGGATSQYESPLGRNS